MTGRSEPDPKPRSRACGYGLAIAVGLSGILIGYAGWPWISDAPSFRFVVRMFENPHVLRRVLQEWGALAPALFIAVQALQVIISPIPGDATGFLGGYLFGGWLGFFYSTVGLAIGSLAAFAVGRALGARYVSRWVTRKVWDSVSFMIEAQGVALCFIVYLIPGLPKDITCYVFGLSPMRFWLFAVTSTLGRMPGTWVLSAQGAHTADGRYMHVLVLTGLVAAVAVPLYYARNWIMAWLRERGARPDESPGRP